MKNFLLYSIIILLASTVQYGQERNSSVQEIDNVITTLYAVISGDAGVRDWDLFRSLFHPEAMMGSIVISDGGKRTLRHFTPDEYIERNGPFFRDRGFWEEEIERITHIYGGIAQVFTSYQYRLEKAGPIRARGINAIQLAQMDNEWKITQIIWEAESDGNPLPELK